jgi:hypothetical protein
MKDSYLEKHQVRKQSAPPQNDKHQVRKQSAPHQNDTRK